MLFSNELVLCLSCFSNLPRTRFHNHPDNDVARIFWGRIPVKNATSFMYFTKDSPYRQILHELKYHHQPDIGLEMGRLFGLELKHTPFAEAEIIHPVPLHISKYRQRGYNQSELIARGISQVLQVPVTSNLVHRMVDTPTQTRKLRYERWENVQHTFVVSDPEQLKGKHLLLIDDVITTGATIEACAEALLSVPDLTLSIASLACVKLQ